MYHNGKADCADCLLGATNRLAGCNSTVTVDRAASKVEGFQALENPCVTLRDNP